MKQIVIWIAMAALLLSLAACRAPEPENPSSGETTTTTTTTTTTIPYAVEILQDTLAEIQPATRYDWADDLPRMDGSTSTIPLEAGIRAALFGISQAEAELQVDHSTTYESFSKLVSGFCDLIFSVPLSEDQITFAQEQNIELEMTAVAAEGFVFVVNAKNPVDTLTQQQLRDIYSGKITNWSEVGGNDAPIIAYQRNETSGSQNFMHTFMGDTPLMDPLTYATMTPISMGQLMDAVAYYDNAENAIGYSVYAYAADMYGNGNEIKFIHVDGVEPSKATMADGSYPLLSYNYAVYDKATPADSNLRRLVEWIVSDEGQRAVKAAGYVPLRPVGEMTEATVQLYTAVGTGKKKPENHKAASYRYEIKGETSDNWQTYEEDVINALKNAALKAEIQEFIRQSEEDMAAIVPDMEWDFYTNLQCINGYLSVRVRGSGSGDTYRTDIRAAIFDLVEGRRIAFSDLFYEGEEFVPQMNAQIAYEIYESRAGVDEADEAGYSLKRTFAGLPAGHDVFTLTTVEFSSDSLYFGNWTSFYPFRGMADKMVLYEPRDMSGVFDDSVTILRSFWVEDGYGVKERLLIDNLYAEVLDERYYDAALCQKVNPAVRTFCRETMSEEALLDWYHKAYADGDFGREGAHIDLRILGNRYLFFEGYTLFFSMEDVDPEYGTALLFDAETGEEVPYTVLLKDGWQEQSRWMKDGWVSYSGETSPYSGEVIAQPDLTGSTLYKIAAWDGGLRLVFGWKNRTLPLATVEIPADYVNWEL